LDLILKGGQRGNKPPRFENLKKEPLENTAEKNLLWLYQGLKDSYLTPKPHFCDENKAFAPIGTPLAVN
jgi:hypothetical protein